MKRCMEWKVRQKPPENEVFGRCVEWGTDKYKNILSDEQADAGRVECGKCTGDEPSEPDERGPSCHGAEVHPSVAI